MVLNKGLKGQGLTSKKRLEQPSEPEENPWLFEGNKANNRFDGTSASDTMFGMAGNDTLMGKAGSDSLYGGNGNDRLWGENGSDLLQGGNGHDLLRGENGMDRLSGGNGNDTLIGGNGNDTLYGGEGNDRYEIENYDSGVDVIQDAGGDNDILDYNAGDFNHTGFSDEGNDLRISMVDGGFITIKNYFDGGPGGSPGVGCMEILAFNNGAVLVDFEDIQDFFNV